MFIEDVAEETGFQLGSTMGAGLSAAPSFCTALSRSARLPEVVELSELAGPDELDEPDALLESLPPAAALPGLGAGDFLQPESPANSRARAFPEIV
jgi:hypothetical protein